MKPVLKMLCNNKDKSTVRREIEYTGSVKYVRSLFVYCFQLNKGFSCKNSFVKFAYAAHPAFLHLFLKCFLILAWIEPNVSFILVSYYKTNVQTLTMQAILCFTAICFKILPISIISM